MPIRSLALVAVTFPFALGCAGTPEARDPLDFRDGTVLSSDGVAIHFREGGRGPTALVFVHGWLGSTGWWTPQMQRFAASQRVVALDLAGHGSSGKERSEWTVERFADDVAAVVRALDLGGVVLVGHSMSGRIVVQAARVLGKRVALVVPVESLNDVEWDLPPEVWAEFFGGLRADFPDAVQAFFAGMLFLPSSPPDVVAHVVAEARASDPSIAIPMLERGRDFDLKTALRALRVPIHAINTDANPTRLETNRKYVASFEVEVLSGVGHWPMLEDPGMFGDALERVVATLRP